MTDGESLAAHVRHIFVANKPDAKTTPTRSTPQRSPFAPSKKWQKYSNCPSGSKGGDLENLLRARWFRPSRMRVGVGTCDRTTEFHQNPLGFHVLWVHSIVIPD